MATNYNPGEPVFDQDDGDLVIDPTTGDAVIVEPGAVWADPATRRVFQRDDVANAMYYRVNTWTGEVLRDQSLGMDFLNVVFASPFVEELVITEFRATMLSTPGVAALTEGRLVSYDLNDRSALFILKARKKDSTTIPVGVAVSG